MTNPKFSILILLAFVFSSSNCNQGVDVSSLLSLAQWECLKNAGYNFVIPRAYCSFGGNDQHILDNLKNANAAGIQYVDVYMFPCRSKDPKDQATQLVTHLKGQKYGQVWIDIEDNPSTGCSWESYTT
jgi:hypothetical protein